MGCAKLADKLHVQKRSLEMLLNALCAMELLDKKDGLYFNTAESDTFLSKKSKRYIGYIIMHHHHLLEARDIRESGNCIELPIVLIFEGKRY